MDEAQAQARLQMLWVLVGCSLMGSVLIWTWWAILIARSVEAQGRHSRLADHAPVVHPRPGFVQ